MDLDRARGRLARRHAHRGFFDPVRDGVAQQVLKRGRHAVQHAPVHVQRAAHDVELDVLAGILGRLTHHPIQALGNAVKLHHPGAQQIALQLSGLTPLGNQVILGALHRALQIALHRGHVMHGLRHHAGEFLHAREAVKFQRIEPLGRVFGLRQTRLHLRLGLQLNVTQLVA